MKLQRSTLNTITDSMLLGQHLAGCPQAFAVLYHRYFDRLVTCARLQGSHEPEECAQDALAKAAAKASTYPGVAFCSVSTWLRRILRNTVTDAWRARNARQTVPLLQDVATLPPNHETARQVQSALAGLPPEQAQALQLHYYDGLTAIEISTRLKVNENTVKGRIRLGAAKLRAAMTETTGDGV